MSLENCLNISNLHTHKTKQDLSVLMQLNGGSVILYLTSNIDVCAEGDGLFHHRTTLEAIDHYTISFDKEFLNCRILVDKGLEMQKPASWPTVRPNSGRRRLAVTSCFFQTRSMKLSKIEKLFDLKICLFIQSHLPHFQAVHCSTLGLQ